MRGEECPSHRGQLVDDCGYCEAAIERAESARDQGRDDDWHVGQDRHERWLAEIAP